MSREFTEMDIHLALDGELSPDEADAFASWLDANPEMKARTARFSADRARLQEALAPIAAEPVPQRLSRAVRGDGGEARWQLSRWRVAASVALFLVGGLGGYLLGISGWQPTEMGDRAFADNAIAAHDVYAAEKLHVVEVGADQKDHLVGWLSKRIGIPLVAPDLTAQGFELIGGRLLPSQNKKAAQFMYQDQAGNRISLYLTREENRSETGFRMLQEGETRAFYWLDEGYGCAVAGVAAEQTLLAVANATYIQLLAVEGS